MEQILIAYVLTQKAIIVIMMLQKNLKAKIVYRSDCDTHFEIIAVILRGDTFAPYIFRLITSNVDRSY